MLTEEENNEIYIGIYAGTITVFNLPENLYEFTASELQKSTYKGWGKSLHKAEVASQEWLLLNDFRENVNVFSGAKTFDQIKESQRLILDKNGVLRPFKEYLADVKELNAVYNEAWLKTERDTAVAQAQNARQWAEFEKDKEDFPYLKYHTQEDSRVRHSHKALNGFTAKVDDPYWSGIMPQNDWRCRCWVEQLESGKRSTKEWEKKRVVENNKGLPNDEKIKSLKDVPDKLFNYNPAKDRIIFKTEGVGSHPYMNVDKAFEVLKADNFGMNINFGL